MSERQRVWRRVINEVPEFAYYGVDLADNFDAIEEIVLGGSPVWRDVHARFNYFRGANVMDIGANRGVYTVFCASKGCHVRAYEPFPLLYSMLASTLQHTGLERLVNLQNAAVTGSTGKVSFIGHATNVGDHIKYNGGLKTCGVNWTTGDFGRAVVVDSVSLDEAIGEEEWDCVKVDVEGGEVDIFLNASEKALSQINFAFVEFHPWIPEEDYRKLIQVLERNFKFEGTFKNACDRWDAAFCTRKPRA